MFMIKITSDIFPYSSWIELPKSNQLLLTASMCLALLITTNCLIMQVACNNDPESAQITFATHYQAKAAHNCQDAVFNNRFIKVFWHRDDVSTSIRSPFLVILSEKPVFDGSYLYFFIIFGILFLS